MASVEKVKTERCVRNEKENKNDIDWEERESEHWLSEESEKSHFKFLMSLVCERDVVRWRDGKKRKQRV